VLVDSLHVVVKGQPEYAIDAVRQDDVLYLTAQAGAPTMLVSDYVFGDDYEESAEDEDADRIRAFITIAGTNSPARVLDALLPPALRYMTEPKLTFNDEGRLASVD